MPPSTISNIADRAVNGPTGFIPFTMGDAETPAGDLTLSVTASGTIVPTHNAVFGGSGANRTVSLTPVPGEPGVTTVTVTVSDGTPQSDRRSSIGS